MALVAAAVVPHSPLLLASIAKHHAERSSSIRSALQRVGEEIYAAQPDVVLFLSPHGQTVEGVHSIEIADQLNGQLVEFGDLTTTVTVPGAVGYAHRLKEASEDAGVTVMLQSLHGLGYSVTVPWLTMWPTPVPWSLVPLTITPQPVAPLIAFGDFLREFIQTRPERVAVIASGDTERRPPPHDTAQRRPTANERLLSEAITRHDVGLLTKLRDTPLCLRDPLVVLLACLQGLPCHGTIRAFDVPLTVGQLVADIQCS